MEIYGAEARKIIDVEGVSGNDGERMKCHKLQEAREEQRETKTMEIKVWGSRKGDRRDGEKVGETRWKRATMKRRAAS